MIHEDTPSARLRARATMVHAMELIGETQRVKPQGFSKLLVGALSVAATLVIAWYALFAYATQHFQVSVFLALLLPICFVTTTLHARVDAVTPVDWALGIAGSAAAIWFALSEARIGNWMAGFSELETGDYVAGTTLVLLTIEICRRTVGIGLTGILFLLLAYVAWGHLLTGSFRHPQVSYGYFLEMQVITTDGIFGSPLYVAASYAFLFVLFGNFYVLSGGGQLFFDLGAALTGRMVGGPAKACVLSSGLYGSISGSPVADVATTGPVSIPIMKKIGIPAERAGAIEAAASTGGSMLPPVMGAVAFIMADFTGVPYLQICIHALLPALGYYFGVFLLVHFEAVRLGLPRLEESQIVGLRIALQRNWPSLIPLGVMMWLLTSGYSAAYVAGGSALSVVAASWFSTRGNRIGPSRFVEGCMETCMSSVPLAAAVAAAGMVIGCIELTGLSGKFTLLLFQLSGGYLVPSLMLSGVILILLGMGMPTTGVYIMGVALLAPVLTGKFGLPTMPVHMFLLFYACLSAITPPVAVANFAAASIAGANPFRLGPYAVKLAIGGFALPFFFLFNRGMLQQGGWDAVAGDTLIGLTLVFFLTTSLHGFVRRAPIPAIVRLCFAGLAAAVIYPDRMLQAACAFAGIALFAALYRAARRREGGPELAAA
ncbi:MAG: TRAP transporter permease [Beijerinckiaceae bacterium]